MQYRCHVHLPNLEGGCSRCSVREVVCRSEGVGVDREVRGTGDHEVVQRLARSGVQLRGKAVSRERIEGGRHGLEGGTVSERGHAVDGVEDNVEDI